MWWATHHKVSGLYISQTLILNLWRDPDLARNLKIQIERDLGSVLSRAFVCRLARVAAAIGSRVIDWGRLTPPSPEQVAGGKIPQQLPG